MTDQLMDDLSNEEHEALLLMSEHGIAPPLSPAADAVLDAYMANCGWLDGPLEKDYRCAAAVLRAAADQVVPAPLVTPGGPRSGQANPRFQSAKVCLPSPPSWTGVRNDH